jgi:hypothetical protein
MQFVGHIPTCRVWRITACIGSEERMMSFETVTQMILSQGVPG